MTGGFSQNNVGIGTNSPDSNAILEMQATNKGILIPRMTAAQRNNMSPSLGLTQKGMLVFDNDSTNFFYWDGVNWRNIASGPQGPPGIANIQMFSVNGSSAVNICGSSYTNIPGLSLTINLIDSARLNIFTNGGLQWTTSNNGGPSAHIGLFKNNIMVPTAYQSIGIAAVVPSYKSESNWCFSSTLILPAGLYAFDIRGSASYDCYNAGSNSYSQSSLIIYVFY